MITALEATAIVNRISATDLYKKSEDDVTKAIEDACVSGADHVQVQIIPAHAGLIVKKLRENGFAVQSHPTQFNAMVDVMIGWPI